MLPLVYHQALSLSTCHSHAFTQQVPGCSQGLWINFSHWPSPLWITSEGPGLSYPASPISNQYILYFGEDGKISGFFFEITKFILIHQVYVKNFWQGAGFILLALILVYPSVIEMIYIFSCSISVNFLSVIQSLLTIKYVFKPSTATIHSPFMSRSAKCISVDISWMKIDSETTLMETLRIQDLLPVAWPKITAILKIRYACGTSPQRLKNFSSLNGF